MKRSLKVNDSSRDSFRKIFLIKIELISTIQKIEEISAEWMELYNQSSNATPFQGLFWVKPWWKNFGKSDLIIITIRNDQQLICIAPFFIYTANQKKRLCLIGSGISDYLDLLYIDNIHQLLSETVGSFLFTISDMWDECYFQDVPDTSPLLNLSKYLSSYSVTVTLSKMSECSFIDAANVENVRTVLPKNLRKNVYGSLKSIETYHTLSLVQSNSSEILIQLHNKRWKQKGSKGVLDDEIIQKMHSDVLNSEYQNNDVSIYSLKMDELTIACNYVLKKKNCVYFYLSGLDPLYSQYSPGTLALFMTIEELFKKGFSRFDFLRGNEMYKHHWGVTFKQNYGIQINKK